MNALITGRTAMTIESCGATDNDISLGFAGQAAFFSLFHRLPVLVKEIVGLERESLRFGRREDILARDRLSIPKKRTCEKRGCPVLKMLTLS